MLFLAKRSQELVECLDIHFNVKNVRTSQWLQNVVRMMGSVWWVIRANTWLFKAIARMGGSKGMRDRCSCLASLKSIKFCSAPVSMKACREWVVWFTFSDTGNNKMGLEWVRDPPTHIRGLTSGWSLLVDLGKQWGNGQNTCDKNICGRENVIHVPPERARSGQFALQKRRWNDSFRSREWCRCRNGGDLARRVTDRLALVY